MDWSKITHRSNFAAHVLLLLLYLQFTSTFMKALIRGRHAQKMVISGQTTIAVGPIVMNRLIKDGGKFQNKGVSCMSGYALNNTHNDNLPFTLTCSSSRWICSVTSWMSESMVFISPTEEVGAMKTSSFTGPLIKKHPKHFRKLNKTTKHTHN